MTPMPAPIPVETLTAVAAITPVPAIAAIASGVPLAAIGLRTLTTGRCAAIRRGFGGSAASRVAFTAVLGGACVAGIARLAAGRAVVLRALRGAAGSGGVAIRVVVLSVHSLAMRPRAAACAAAASAFVLAAAVNKEIRIASDPRVAGLLTDGATLLRVVVTRPQRG
jgi:hypothetical protein